MRRFLLTLLLLSAGRSVSAEEKLRIFLDCDFCDVVHLKQHVTFVDYVRDRADAQVHVLITTRSSGNGDERSIRFTGGGAYAGKDQVVISAVSSTNTTDESRKLLASALSLGLMRYVAGTPLAQAIEIVFKPDGVVSVGGKDPWNFWLFGISAYGSVSGEENSEDSYFSGSLSANRTTPAWKISLGLSGENREQSYTLDDGSEVRSGISGHRWSGSVIKSVRTHWGIGVSSLVSHSSYYNIDRGYQVTAALEYSVFPYVESSERTWTFTHTVGGKRMRFLEETVLGHIRQTVLTQGISTRLAMKRSWGDAKIGAGYSYQGKPGQSQLSLDGEVKWRIVKGLSLGVSGRATRTRDQIYLPASVLTSEEILLGNQARQSGFNYSASTNLSFTFGSIHNSIVNARLDEGF